MPSINQDEQQGTTAAAHAGPMRSQSHTFDISEYAGGDGSVAVATPPPPNTRRRPAAAQPHQPQQASGPTGSRGNPVSLASDVPAADSAENVVQELPAERAVGRARPSPAGRQRVRVGEQVPAVRPAPAPSTSAASVTAPVPAAAPHPAVRFWRWLGPTAPYVAALLGILLFLGLHFGANQLGNSAQNILRRAVNGDTPKVDKYAYLGHAGELPAGVVPGQPSYLLTANVNGNLGLIEAPGGNWANGKIYEGPPLLGDGADQTAVQIVIQDINCDGKPDVGEQIGNKIIYYINDGSALMPLKTSADVAAAMAACPSPTPTVAKGGTK